MAPKEPSAVLDTAKEWRDLAKAFWEIPAFGTSSIRLIFYPPNYQITPKHGFCLVTWDEKKKDDALLSDINPIADAAIANLLIRGRTLLDIRRGEVILPFWGVLIAQTSPEEYHAFRDENNKLYSDETRIHNLQDICWVTRLPGKVAIVSNSPQDESDQYGPDDVPQDESDQYGPDDVPLSSMGIDFLKWSVYFCLHMEYQALNGPERPSPPRRYALGLRKLIEKADLNQTDFAIRVDVGRTYLNKLVNRKEPINNAMLFRLMKWFKCSESDILDDPGQ